MRNSQKALGRFLTILLGLAMVMLLANCSGDSFAPVANQSADGPDLAPGPGGDESTGDSDEEALNDRLDQGAGVAEATSAVSGLIGAAGGSLKIRYHDVDYILEIGSGVLSHEIGVGFQVTRGINKFGEQLIYLSFSPQNASLNGAATFKVINPAVNGADLVGGLFSQWTKADFYVWNASGSWQNAGSSIVKSNAQTVQFEVSEFGTYALLVYPTDIPDDNAS